MNAKLSYIDLYKSHLHLIVIGPISMLYKFFFFPSIERPYYIRMMVSFAEMEYPGGACNLNF